MGSPWKKRLLIIVAALCAVYLVLLIPESSPPHQSTADSSPFFWNQDDYWSDLERRFKEVRSIGCAEISPKINRELAVMDSLIAGLGLDTLPPEAPVFTEIESRFFELATYLAACPERMTEYASLFGRLRTLVKQQSTRWDMNSRAARDRVYRLLYGGRMAVEEVMVQTPAKEIPEVMPGRDEPSATPSASILGVTIHSGDILVSRGGAPTSALIARGHDYPGNFSHAALVHVDDSTGQISIIESHIEKGVAVANIDDYFRDTKLRVMVLRLRADLPAMKTNPMLPHRAAEFELGRARTEHIPYDFAMDSDGHGKLYCSEVVSEAYERKGIRLWQGVSHISSAGAKSWLAAFGVRNFAMQEPSDLEFDPQLRVVAEWRDFETLYDGRLDNATVDVMLESADSGRAIGYDWYMLPPIRFLKAYSTLLNQFHRVGPIPEGMNATAALRNVWFSRMQRAIKAELRVLADRFEIENGYPPPYWELVKLARQAAEFM